MAHLRSITHQCDWAGCSTRAIEQLYSFRNEPMGRYCSTHAKRALREAKSQEEVLFALQRQAPDDVITESH